MPVAVRFYEVHEQIRKCRRMTFYKLVMQLTAFAAPSAYSSTQRRMQRLAP
jgi:hypothetical protein